MPHKNYPLTVHKSYDRFYIVTGTAFWGYLEPEERKAVERFWFYDLLVPAVNDILKRKHDRDLVDLDAPPLTVTVVFTHILGQYKVDDALKFCWHIFQIDAKSDDGDAIDEDAVNEVINQEFEFGFDGLIQAEPDNQVSFSISDDHSDWFFYPEVTARSVFQLPKTVLSNQRSRESGV